MKQTQKILKPLLVSCGVFVAVVVGTGAYAAINTPVPLPADYKAGNMVTSSGLNEIKNGVKTLDNRTINIFTDNKGNTGIGTKFPQVKLEVEGEFKASGIKTSAVKSWSDLFLNASQSIIKNTEAPLHVPAGNVILQYYDDGRNGNVGIGKKNPVEALDVLGGIQASGTIKGKKVCDTAGNCLDNIGITGGESVEIGSDFISTTPTGIAILSGNEGNTGARLELKGEKKNPYIDFANGLKDDYDIRLQLVSDNLFAVKGGGLKIEGGDLNVSGNIVGKSICDTAGNCLDKLGSNNSVWTESGDNVHRVKGNIGIGTDKPSNKLTVAGDSSIVNGSIGFNRNPTTGALPTGGKSDYGRFQLTPFKTKFEIQAYDTSGKNTGAIVLNALNGNVGIGKDPIEKLDVNGKIKSNNEIISQSAQGLAFISAVESNGGARMELKGNKKTPYIDFANGLKDDYDMRIELKSDNLLGVHGGDLTVYEGGLNVFGDAKARSFLNSSDINLKKNIVEIESPAEKLSQIRGVYFDWRIDSKKDVGVIAQEVEKVLPEAVKETGDHKSVDYTRLVPLLIATVNDQQKEIEYLKSEIDSLKK